MHDAPRDPLLEQLTATALNVAEAKQAGVSTDDALRGMRQTRAPKLTAVQRRRVRELVEDEGCSRAEAVAWVLEMEGR